MHVCYVYMYMYVYVYLFCIIVHVHLHAEGALNDLKKILDALAQGTVHVHCTICLWIVFGNSDVHHLFFTRTCTCMYM